MTESLMVRVVLHTDLIRGGAIFREGDEIDLPEAEAKRFIERRMAVECAALTPAAETASIPLKREKRNGRNS